MKKIFILISIIYINLFASIFSEKNEIASLEQPLISKEVASLNLDKLKYEASLNIASSQSTLGYLYLSGELINKDYKKAFDLLSHASKLNNHVGINLLGYMYENGLYVKKDFKKAFELYSKAAKSDNIDAFFNLGRFYFYGIAEKKDYKQAFDLFSKSYKMGNVSSSYYLGFYYKEGFFVKKDEDKALDLFLLAFKNNMSFSAIEIGSIYLNKEKHIRKKAEKFLKIAAESGDAKAEYLLYLYYYSFEDIEKSLNWLKKSVKNDYIPAKISLSEHYITGNIVKKNYKVALNLLESVYSFKAYYSGLFLGKIYFNGLGVEKNNKKAYEYFLASANKGNMESQSFIALFYLNGIFIEKNIPMYIKWMKMSSSSGYAFAMESLGSYYNSIKDYEKALFWFNKGKKENYTPSIFSLAKMYAEGKGVKLDYLKAIELYTIAADANHVFSQNNLGFIFGFVKKHIDYEKAFKYLSLSANANFDKAKNNLAYLYINGLGVKQNCEKGLSLLFEAKSQNNVKSSYQLGKLYKKGICLEKDLVKAEEEFLVAIKNGNIDSMVELAMIYINYQKKDSSYTQKTINLLKKAASYNNAYSQFTLASYYLDIKNYDKSLFYHESAIKNGFEKAKCSIAIPLLKLHDSKENRIKVKNYIKEAFKVKKFKMCHKMWNRYKLYKY